MKFNYLFVNKNNGHGRTYHPFKSDTVLHQDRITEWLDQVPGARRTGTSLGDLLDRLDKENIPFEEFRCPCCGELIHQLNLTNEPDFRRWQIMGGITWIMLEGISGNY